MSEFERISGALRAFGEWQSEPALTPGQVARLAGISRVRVWHLVDRGVFRQTRNREILLRTVLGWYEARASKLSGEGKCQCREWPKALGKGRFVRIKGL